MAPYWALSPAVVGRCGYFQNPAGFFDGFPLVEQLFGLA
jgi:hypothetical protein